MTLSYPYIASALIWQNQDSKEHAPSASLVLYSKDNTPALSQIETRVNPSTTLLRGVKCAPGSTEGPVRILPLTLAELY